MKQYTIYKVNKSTRELTWFASFNSEVNIGIVNFLKGAAANEPEAEYVYTVCEA